MHTCGKCKATFDIRKDYSRHQKQCVVGAEHGTKLFVSNIGREVTVFLNERGLYACLCSATGCPQQRGFKTLEGLKKHLRNKKTWVDSASTNPPSNPQLSQSDDKPQILPEEHQHNIQVCIPYLLCVLQYKLPSI